MSKLIEVNYDVFDVVKRIKRINSRYRLYFNAENGTYKLKSDYGVKQVDELTLPSGGLNEGTITHILKTKVENFKKLIDEIDKQNNAFLEAKKALLLKKMQKQIEDNF